MLRIAVACRLDPVDVAKDGRQHLGRRLGGINLVNQLAAIEIQDRVGFALIGFEAMLDDIQVGVVEAVFAQGAALEAVHEFFEIWAAKVKNAAHVQRVLEHLSLADVAGDAVQDESVRGGLETAGALDVYDELTPEINRGLVRDEFAAAGIFEEDVADIAIGGEVAENVAASAMEKVGNAAEDFALGPF